MIRDSSGRELKTTRRSLEIVETVVEGDGATTSELVEELELAQSTVHNHVNTLVEHGYLTEEANEYYPGAKFCQIGDYVRRRKPEYVIAGEIVSELSDETELDVDFSVEESGRIISLFNGLRQNENAHFLNAGRFFDVHSNASGKAILAEYTDDRVEKIIDQRGLPARTENTITSREELFEELDRIPERGYAINNEEAIEGLWAIGKVVKDPFGKVVGSLNLSGPLYLHNDEMEQTGHELLNESVAEFEERCESRYNEKYGLDN